MALPPADSFANLPLLREQQDRRRIVATWVDYCCSFLLTLVYGAVILFGFISLPIIIFCVFVEPKLTTVQVDSATVTTTTAAATFDLTFAFRNPDYIFSVSYRDLEAKVWFGNDNLILASTPLNPFSQGARDETKVRAQLTVVNGSVNGDDVAAEIAAKRAGGGGSVKFGVSLSGLIRYSYDTLQRYLIPLRVECEPLIMAFAPGNDTGTLVGPCICSAV